MSARRLPYEIRTYVAPQHAGGTFEESSLRRARAKARRLAETGWVGGYVVLSRRDTGEELGRWTRHEHTPPRPY